MRERIAHLQSSAQAFPPRSRLLERCRAGWDNNSDVRKRKTSSTPAAGVHGGAAAAHPNNCEAQEPRRGQADVRSC